MRRAVLSGVALLCVNVFAQSEATAQAAAAKPTHPVLVLKTFYRSNPMTVYQALEATYKSAGLKSPEMDKPNFVMSYLASPVGSKVGNATIERIADCGGEKKSPLAKTTPLTLKVKSEVKRVEEGAELSTTVEIFPTDSTSNVVCISTQVLEKKIEPTIGVMIMKGGVH